MINSRRLLVLLACLWASPVFAQTSGQMAGNLTATTGASSCVTMPVAGMGTGSVQIVGTWVGTVSFTVANTGDAADYKALNMAPSNSSTQVSTSTANGLWSGSVAGYRFFRACMTSYTSGIANVLLSAAATGGGGAGAVTVDLTGSSISGNSAASATGSAVPAAADYLGISVGGTLTGVVAGQATMANSIPVTLASNQSSLTVLPGNTANTTAWLVTGTGGTFPATQSGTWNITNISGTVSLPTGAATAAKQPALGTAGTSSADVLTVQGRASMTPILATLSGTNAVNLNDGAGNALTSLAAGAQRAITVSVLDSSGNQISSFGGSGGTSSAFGSTFPSGASSGSAVGFNDGTNMQAGRVVDADTGGGTFYTLATNSVFRASGTPVEAGTSSNPWNVVFPSTQAVSGPLTDTQLRATAVPVSGTVTATGPLTDTQLRASAVPISVATIPSHAVTNAGTFATQVTSLPALATGTNVIGALTANQSVNVAQFNGVTPLMGAGNSGTGSQRVTIATDQAALPITVASIPSHAVTNAGTFSVQVTSMPADATELPAASALADAMANPTTPLVGAAMMAYNGTTWDRLQPALDYAQNSVTSGQTGSLVQGAVTTSSPTYTSGRTSPVSLDTSGSLRVAVVSGSTGNAASSNTGSAVPTQGGYTGVNVGGTLRGLTGVNPSGTVYAGQMDLAAVAGATTSVNNGTVDAGTLRVTVASNSTGTLAATQSGTWTVQPGNTANTTAWLVAGGKTNNNAAPGATNLGALVALANASAPSWTEGNLVALSTDLTGALRVSGGGGGTQYTQDAALTVGSSVGNMAMGRASAAVPTDVSADNDAVMPWYLRSGAEAVQNTFGGVLAVAGNGVSGTGVQRVTIASDSTGTVALAAGSATIGALTANQSVNVAQINGVTTLMGNGVSGTGAQRVTIASDSTGQIALATGANTIGALSANQTVNVAQVNGVTTTMGNGVSGTGVQRVTLASDSTGVLGATQSGTWTMQPGNTANTTAWLVAGGKTNNNAAPGATNVGALTGLANAAAPSFTEGNLVALSTDLAGNLRVTGGGGGTQYTQDGALTVATTIGTMAMGRASAAAPTDVSADNDAVMPWYLRSGAVVGQPTFGGVLATTGNGVAGTGVQRVTLASDSTGTVALAAGAATIGALTANQSVNVAQINGVTPLMGNGASGTGAQRVTLANDSTGILATVTTVSTVTNLSQLGGVALPIEDAAETAGGVGIYAMGVRRDVAATSASTTGDNTMASYNNVGAQWISHIDPCSSEAKVTAPFSMTARTLVIAAVASKKNYICAIAVVAGAAEIFNIDEGTGTTCQTGTAAIAGSTTAANGLSFAANGGFSAIGSNSTVLAGITANVDTCIVPSGANRLSGFITYVQR